MRPKIRDIATPDVEPRIDRGILLSIIALPIPDEGSTSAE